MAEIAPSNKADTFSCDTGKTSPLSDLPTSPPTILKSGSTQSNKVSLDHAEDHAADTTTAHPDSESITNGQSSKTEERSRSIISNESSDLSDLDSEADTERMSNQGDSELKRLSKVNDDDVTHEADEEADTTLEVSHHKDETTNDQFIKNEVINELTNHKEEQDMELDCTEQEFSQVVKDLKADVSSELQTNGHKRSLTEDESHPDVPELPVKKAKLHTDAESQPVNNISNIQVTGEGDEAEDEEEDEENDIAAEAEEDEEEEAEELTEQQKLEKQLEMELEAEKQKVRKEALEFLSEIEVDFAKLRDRLYEDKMERFKSELEMCLNGSHPELQTVYSKIDAVRAEKIKQAELARHYKRESIFRKTIAQRTQIHQQFYKLMFDSKNKLLKDITEQWYKINKERRLMDLLVPEYSYKIPTFTDQLVYQREQYNKEVSILVGLNKYYGFPAAPQLKPVDDNELEEDLKLMTASSQ